MCVDSLSRYHTVEVTFSKGPSKVGFKFPTRGARRIGGTYPRVDGTDLFRHLSGRVYGLVDL